jgi:hypothetical protein
MKTMILALAAVLGIAVGTASLTPEAHASKTYLFRAQSKQRRQQLTPPQGEAEKAGALPVFSDSMRLSSNSAPDGLPGTLFASREIEPGNRPTDRCAEARQDFQGSPTKRGALCSLPLPESCFSHASMRLAPTRVAALASPLRQFTGWTITANCPACRILRSRTVETLMVANGGAIRWWRGCAVSGAAASQTGCVWRTG